MKRDELVKILAWRLGDRKDMAERITAEMDFVQRTVLEEHAWLPWFLESGLATASTKAGERRVSLPADFLMEIEESHLWVLPVGGTPARLHKGAYDKLQAKNPGTGQPHSYCISGDSFQLFPTPDGVYALQMQFYGRDTLMSVDNVETKWLRHASDVVLAAIGKELTEKHLQNPAQAQAFATDLAKAWERLYSKHVALAEINQVRSMNGDA